MGKGVAWLGGLIVGLLLMVAAPSWAQDADRVVRPDWTHRPTAQDLGRLYPTTAHGVTAKVVLDCVLDEKGRFGTCDVVTEDPPGLGFGDATLKLSRLFQMKAIDGDGRPVAGRKLHLPVRWDAGFGR